MRALFYLLDGETNASSQHRALQYFPLLRKHGIQPCAARPVPEPLYQRLIERGDGTLSEKLAFYGLFASLRLADVLRADRFDVVVIQRDLFPFGPPLLERALIRRNPKLVYDTDDATYLRPGFTPDTPFQRLRRFDKVADVVARARWVSAATEPICKWARRYNSCVSVVPMAVDLDEYDRAPRPRSSGSRLVLGWTGTPGGLRYLEALGPLLRSLADKYALEVRVISGKRRDLRLPGVPLDWRPWRPETALQDIAEFDIGLVPLDDTPFEQAKFPFKLLQYMALGVPSVSAPVGQAATLVHHGSNGLLAGTQDEWRDALESLIGDPARRTRVGRAGRETVAASYTVERIAPLLINGLSRAAA